jgi:hypothetical protein
MIINLMVHRTMNRLEIIMPQAWKQGGSVTSKLSGRIERSIVLAAHRHRAGPKVYPGLKSRQF